MSRQDSIPNLMKDSVTSHGEMPVLQVFETSERAESLLTPEFTTALIPRMIDFAPGWLFIYLLVMLGLFAWIRIYYGNIYAGTIQASTNFLVAARMFKDKSLLQNQLDNVLYVIYFLSMAYFMFFIEERMGLVPYRLGGFLLYLFNLALLLGVFLARALLVNLMGSLFNQLVLFREYLYHTFIFNKLLGIIILPLLLFVMYTQGIVQQIFTWISFGTLGVILVMRIIRGVAFSFKKDISIFYMFLYLCALELAPLVLLYRWLEGVL